MFEHLKSLDVANTTSWMPLPWLGRDARVEMRPATQDNPFYFNAMLARASRRVREVGAQAMVDPKVEDINRNRKDDRELFARFVIVNWEGLLDSEGKPVPFTKENVAEFCAVLPAWLFDKVRDYAASPERFVSRDTADAENLAGNSKSGSSGS